MLTARAAGFAGFENQVLWIDLNFNVLYLGKHGHRSGRGLDSSLGFGFGNTLYAMNAAFKFEAGLGAVSLDHKRDLTEAAKLSLVGAHKRGAKALGLGIHTVHSVKDSRK